MFALPVWLFPSFFLTALLYASVGFGGGSSYLALLSMTPLPLKEVAAIALFCNLIVAGGGVWHFSKAGQMRVKLLWPFLLTSIPAAYFGGLMKTEDSVQRAALGICLLFVALRIWLGGHDVAGQPRKTSGAVFVMTALSVGGLLGFLSGYLGIGGGIFLSPLLILMGWANVKESSAAAALFILLNSAAGLAARGNFLQAHFHECLILGAVVFVGGQLGSMAGTYRLSHPLMRKILVGFISCASFRLLWLAL